jgi:hypothetical protein
MVYTAGWLRSPMTVLCARALAYADRFTFHPIAVVTGVPYTPIQSILDYSIRQGWPRAGCAN